MPFLLMISALTSITAGQCRSAGGKILEWLSGLRLEQPFYLSADASERYAKPSLLLEMLITAGVDGCSTRLGGYRHVSVDATAGRSITPSASISRQQIYYNLPLVFCVPLPYFIAIMSFNLAESAPTLNPSVECRDANSALRAHFNSTIPSFPGFSIFAPLYILFDLLPVRSSLEPWPMKKRTRVLRV